MEKMLNSYSGPFSKMVEPLPSYPASTSSPGGMEAPCSKEPLGICSEVLNLEQERWTKPQSFCFSLRELQICPRFLGSYLLQPDKHPAKHSSGH